MSYAPTEALACDGRLTLLSGTPVPTTDQLNKTTVYFTPFRGNRIAVYDGASLWLLRTFSELSVAVPATTATPFDIFAYDNAGAVALETANWTNDTTRATALTIQDGVPVKSGAMTRRYLGTGRTTNVSGQTEDSGTKRFLYNAYHRVPRVLQRYETTANWTYATPNWRYWNNSAANKVEFVCGLPEDRVNVRFSSTISSTASSAAIGLGLDANTPTVPNGRISYASGGNEQTPTAEYQGFPNIGYHYIAMLEFSITATSTFYGVNTYDGDRDMQSGLDGEIWA